MLALRFCFPIRKTLLYLIAQEHPIQLLLASAKEVLQLGGIQNGPGFLIHSPCISCGANVPSFQDMTVNTRQEEEIETKKFNVQRREIKHMIYIPTTI